MYTYCIAEDEFYVQKSIESRIRALDLGLECAGFAFTGQEAEALYDRHRPDLFFVDINMPRGSGFDFIEMIRKKDPACSTLFIIISGYSDYQNMQKAIRVEVFDYLQKPIVPGEFATMLRRAVQALERREAEKRKVWVGEMPEGPKGEEPAEQSDEQKDRIEEICAYIRTHYRDDLSVKFLSEIFYLSQGYIAHLFKNKMGTTPGKYLEEIRLEQAHHLLCHTDLRIQEVAEQTGYKDGNYFTKCFRKKYGISPSEIRKNRK